MRILSLSLELKLHRTGHHVSRSEHPQKADPPRQWMQSWHTDRLGARTTKPVTAPGWVAKREKTLQRAREAAEPLMSPLVASLDGACFNVEAVPPKYDQTVRHQAILIGTCRHEIFGSRIRNGTCQHLLIRCGRHKS